MNDTKGVVYLLHFTRPVPRQGSQGVRHYLGWVREGNLERRLRQHRQPSPPIALLRALRREGGDFVLARTWEGETPADEKRRKRNGHIGELCPLCRGRPDM